VLRGLGLDADADAVYRCLLREPGTTVDGLIQSLDLSEDRVRAGLLRLSELELMEAWPGDSGRFQPVSPAVGLTALLAPQEVDVAQRNRQIHQMRAQIASLAREWQDAKHGTDVDVEWLDSIKAVQGRLATLAPASTTETLSFHPRPSPAPALPGARDLNQTALNRGVVLRGIRQDSCRLDTPTLHHMTWLAGRGAQIRTAPLLPVQMIIFDRRLALVEIDPEEPGRGAVLLSAPGVVAALHALFEAAWSGANPFGQPAARDRQGITAAEHELLCLLLDGHTDDSAARKLGVSLRTVRRTMAALTTRLGAQSRFQVGAFAQARGWLDR